MIKEIEALVKRALIRKFVLSSKLMLTEFESDEFFEILSEYNDLFFEVHNEISKLVQPMILSDNMTESALGCLLLKKYYTIFGTQRTVAEKTASKMCLEYL